MENNSNVADQLTAKVKHFKAIVAAWQNEGAVDIFDREFTAICNGLRELSEEDRQNVYELIWYTVTRKMIARGYDSTEVRRIASIFIKRLKDYVSSGRQLNFSGALIAAEREYEQQIQKFSHAPESERGKHALGATRLFAACGYMASDFHSMYDVVIQGNSPLSGLLLSVFCGLVYFVDAIDKVN